MTNCNLVILERSQYSLPPDLIGANQTVNLERLQRVKCWLFKMIKSYLIRY